MGASGGSVSTSTESAASKGEEDDQNKDDEGESDPAVEPKDGESPSTTDQDRECKTNDEGPVKNKTCVFPFIYGEQIHHSCVEIGECRSWCATKVDADGKYCQDEWGYCGEDCVFTMPHPGTIMEKAVNDEEITGDNVVSTSPEMNDPVRIALQMVSYAE